VRVRLRATTYTLKYTTRTTTTDIGRTSKSTALSMHYHT